VLLPVTGGFGNERCEEALVFAHLGVPEHTDRETAACVFERLGGAVVGGVPGDPEPVADAAEALMVM
jgi:hypothetical protein